MAATLRSTTSIARVVVVVVCMRLSVSWSHCNYLGRKLTIAPALVIASTTVAIAIASVLALLSHVEIRHGRHENSFCSVAKGVWRRSSVAAVAIKGASAVVVLLATRIFSRRVIVVVVSVKARIAVKSRIVGPDGS